MGSVNKHQPECCCGPTAPCSGFARVTVTGCCGKPLPGASVVFSRGGTQVGATQTTDAQGQATVAMDAAGVYAIAVSKARFADGTVATSSLACDGLVHGYALTLAPAAGYDCLGCADPFSTGDTFTVSDHVSNFPDTTLTAVLSWSSAGFDADGFRGPGWIGTGTWTRDNVYVIDTSVIPNQCTTAQTTQTIPVIYRLTCSGGQTRYQRGVPTCFSDLAGPVSGLPPWPVSIGGRSVGLIQSSCTTFLAVDQTPSPNITVTKN